MKNVKVLSLFITILFASGQLFNLNGQNKSKTTETKWFTLKEAQTLAAESNGNKLIMLFVEAEWCGICKQMHKLVFPTAKVSNQIDTGFLPVSLDLDSREVVNFFGTELTKRELAQKLNVQATPTTIFIDSSGEVLANHMGFLDANDLISLLTFLHSDEFGKIDFIEFKDGL